MDDLVQWLGEQLDEDERLARAATPGPWSRMGQRVLDPTPPSDRLGVGMAVGHAAAHADFNETAEHIAEHDPARVLREVDAKRQLIREVLEYESSNDFDRGCAHSADYFASGLHHGHMPKDILGLRLIASGYSHRPGFREEWRP